MVVDFQYADTRDGAIIKAIAATLDAGKSWISLEELVIRMEECEDDIIWFNHLAFVFRSIEPYILARGWINKYCQDKGKGWHPYCSALKPLNYTVQLWGVERRCSALKMANKSGKSIRVLDASKWIKGADLALYTLTERDYNFLKDLKPLKNTPAATAKEKIGKITRQGQFDLNIFFDLKTAIQGGLIKLYVPKGSFYKEAYHYDITSLYPSILCGVKNFPSIQYAEYTTEDEKADHENYAYWISQNNKLYCDAMIETVPAGSLKMPLYMPNNIINNVHKLFEKKQQLNKGTVEYNEIKIELNSFIGCFIQRDYNSDFYPYTSVDKDMVLCATKKSFRQLYEVYEYIIALAHKRIIQELYKAEAQGAHILQVNTDGFFTDKPIEYDAEKSLGSLRFEYHAHNLTLFACNQYACDEEICIAGLPSEYYNPDSSSFGYKIMTYDREKKNVVFATKTLTLGEEVIYER